MTALRARHLPVTLPLGVMLMTMTAAMSQDFSGALDLGTIELRTQEDTTGPVADRYNAPTVTGSKFPTRVNAIPQSVSVISREDATRFGATTATEALRYSAGVSTDVFGDDQDYDWLRIRGFQADQTGIYLDNAQNLSYAFGSFYIDPYTIESIEVLRGPSSALYGGSNPGGLVNYVSKRPGGHIGEASLGVNDAGRIWLEADYGDDISDGGAYRVTGRLEFGDQYDDFNDGYRGTLAPSFKFTTDGGTELTLLANLHYADENHNGGTFLPYVGTVVPANYGYIDPEANFSDPSWDEYLRKQASVSGIVEHEFDNGFTFTGIARLGIASLEERYYYPFGYTGFAAAPGAGNTTGDLSLVAFEHDTLTRTAQTDLRYYGTLNTGAVTHDVLVGLDARFYELDQTQASGSGANSAANPMDPGTPAIGNPYIDSVTQQRQVGIYAQDQIRWGGGWIGTLNLRHDFVDTEASGTNAFDRSDSETSYRVALGHEFEAGITPYLSYASFFNPIIGAPEEGVTEPESGDQIELGLKWAPEDRNFALTAALFDIDRENVLVGPFMAQRQIGEVESRGFELEGKYDFGNGLQVGGALTFLDVEIQNDANADLIGNTPTLIPEQEASIYGSYAFAGTLDGLTLGAGLRYRGDSYANEANTLEVPSSTVFDMFATYDVSDNLQARLSVTNLGDRRYVTGCQTEFVCSYGSEREISFSVTSQF